MKTLVEQIYYQVSNQFNSKFLHEFYRQSFYNMRDSDYRQVQNQIFHKIWNRFEFDIKHEISNQIKT